MLYAVLPFMLSLLPVVLLFSVMLCMLLILHGVTVLFVIVIRLLFMLLLLCIVFVCMPAFILLLLFVLLYCLCVGVTDSVVRVVVVCVRYHVAARITLGIIGLLHVRLFMICICTMLFISRVVFMLGLVFAILFCVFAVV